jgi:TPR repeat protein
VFAALSEAMSLGSSQAALDLGSLLLEQADTPTEVQAALELIERAANDGLVEAQVLLGNEGDPGDTSARRGMAAPRRAGVATLAR